MWSLPAGNMAQASSSVFTPAARPGVHPHLPKNPTLQPGICQSPIVLLLPLQSSVVAPLQVHRRTCLILSELRRPYGVSRSHGSESDIGETLAPQTLIGLGGGSITTCSQSRETEKWRANAASIESFQAAGLQEQTLPASWHSLRGNRRFQKAHLYTLMARSMEPCPSLVVRGQVGTSGAGLEAVGVTDSGLFTLSEEDLAGRGLRLSEELNGLDLDQLNTLFAKVGFPKREKAKLQIALEHTLAMLWLSDIESGQLVAFARATGDAVFNAIIWDVVVDPQYQGLGLGKVVMERLMARLLALGICNIALYAEPNVVGFYRPLGFVTDPDNIRGMAYKRKQAYKRR